ncbi:MAG: hypothetical protein M3N93_03925 [Acidobacteriota bacterium]|nr:hypothetical protein [Acidobacteriota bacterium]
MTKPAILLLFPCMVLAQDTVAPTTGETTAPTRGQNAGAYNVAQSWELGYRYASIGGDQGKYRSDVNYRDGVRLLSSYLTVNSRDGRGRSFDEIVLTTQGLGNDPYESATLRVQKNSLYRYDMLWRSNDYFNPGLTVSNGEHSMDTKNRWQDHELTLFPQSWFRVRAGYNRTVQLGPALTTTQEYDARGDVFPIFRDLKEQYNEYRIGADVTRKSFRFTLLRRWEYFKEDSTDALTATLQGASDLSTLTGFQRSQPARGNTRGWLGNLYAERKWIAVNARFTYAGGRGAFIQNESALGVDRFGTSQNRQVSVTSNGDRSVTTGDLNVTILPLLRFSIVNNTSISNTNITGNNAYTQFDNATLSAQTVNFQFLGVRLITNATDLRYRLSRRIDAFAGFRYSARLIRSIEDSTVPDEPVSGISAQQSNHLKAGVAGVNLLLVKDLRVHAEGEVGVSDNPFTPVSLRNYHAIRSRVNYRKKGYSLGGGYQENYNNNSITVTAYSSHARTWSAEASWSATPWLAVDASYSKLHLDTVGGLAFFAGSPRTSLVTNQESIYISNIHAANLGVRLPVTRRADIYLGYNITKDTGDGRGALVAQTTAIAQIFYNVQTYPLTYQTPLARVSIRITPKLRYNLGYQYYGYHEGFGLLSEVQSYRAHTGYTSLLWSF